MPTHTPSNKLQLRALIQHAIERDGPGCDLSGIDVSRITDFSYTFMNLSFFGNVSTWRMTQAQTVRNMFEKAILSTDLSAWDTSNVEDFSAMFEHASGRVGDIGLWNTRSARNMSAMFAHSSLGADLRYWDVGHVRNFARMFQCYTKPLHVSEWNTSSATLLSGMFEGACIEEDLSRWTVSNVLSFHGMFAHSNFKGDVSRWDVNKGQNFGHMFEGSPFCGDLSQWVFGDGLSSVAFDKSIDAQVFARLPACVVHWYWAWAASLPERMRWLDAAHAEFLALHERLQWSRYRAICLRNSNLHQPYHARPERDGFKHEAHGRMMH